MRYVLDPEIKFASTRLAVVSEVHLSHGQVGNKLYAQGQKHPVAILVVDQNGSRVYDLSGLEFPKDKMTSALMKIIEDY